MATQPVEIKIPQKNIDLDLLIFVERYVTSHLKWDILTYFGQHPNEKETVEDIAGKIGRHDRVVRPEIGDLAMLGVLKKTNNLHPPVYQLTNNFNLRTQVLKFARQKNNPLR